jgi:hypothetical protein
VGPIDAVLALTALAAEAGVRVRIEPFPLKLVGKGGLCRLDGQAVILVDAALGPLEQAGVLGRALGVFFAREERPRLLPPALRSYLRTGHAPVKALLRPRPLARAR